MLHTVKQNGYRGRKGSTAEFKEVQRDPPRAREGRGQDVNQVSAGGQKNESKASASASAAAESGCWMRAEWSLRSVRCGATGGRIRIKAQREVVQGSGVCSGRLN